MHSPVLASPPNAMMYFILLPFLLATGLVDDDTERWMHGPEYTFNVRIGMISSLRQDHGRHLGSSLLCEMKCRPKDSDSLICRFENARSTKIEPRGMDPKETEPRKNATFDSFGIGKSRFQIKFNDRGIESYVVEKDDYAMNPLLVNMYRMIANQLSVGVNLNSAPMTFRAMENFTTGECSALFDVIRDKFNETSKDFEIVSLSDLRIEDDQVVRIVKKRELSDCIPHKVYFFGTRYTYGVVLRDSIEKLVSSATRMSISKYSFTSETVNILNVYDSNRKLLGSVLDHLTLSLDSVKPAETSIKPILYPKSTGVVVSTRCENYELHNST